MKIVKTPNIMHTLDIYVKTNGSRMKKKSYVDKEKKKIMFQLEAQRTFLYTPLMCNLIMYLPQGLNTGSPFLF